MARDYDPEQLLRESNETIAALRAEIAALEAYTEDGREFYPDGTEHPTTILDRVKMLGQCLAAESQGGDEARRALGDARRHVQEYRRCIRVALDEQRERQDVGVLMTDLEDLLDQMADQSPLSRDLEPDPDPEFTFEQVGPTFVDLPVSPKSGVTLTLTIVEPEETVLIGTIDGNIVLELDVPVTVEAVRVEGPVELNKDPPTVWKRTGASDAD